MAQGFFQALFDLSFRRFITLRLTGILYAIAAIALALGGLYALGWSLAGFGESLGQGLLRLVVLAPLGFLLYAIWVRILLEASVSLIRVAQNTSDILEELRKKP
jgi:small-conductance mechanosensitive channel